MRFRIDHYVRRHSTQGPLDREPAMALGSPNPGKTGKFGQRLRTLPNRQASSIKKDTKQKELVNREQDILRGVRT